MNQLEQVVDILPSGESQRLVVLSRECAPGSEPQLVLREETLSDTGWFAQSEVSLSLEQLSGLKLLLTSRKTTQLVQDTSTRPVLLPIGQYQISRRRSG